MPNPHLFNAPMSDSRVAHALAPLKPVLAADSSIVLQMVPTTDRYLSEYMIVFADGSRAEFTDAEIHEFVRHTDAACQLAVLCGIEPQDWIDLVLCAWMHSLQRGGPCCATCENTEDPEWPRYIK